MPTPLTPNDLGESPLSENCVAVSIQKVLKQYQHSWKDSLLSSNLLVGVTTVRLACSDTRWGGKRLWFACPICKKKCGILYTHPLNEQVGCRKCLGVKYWKQRYRGMVEQGVGSS